jgi:tetratricopeptide (TPR) repeat protein
VTNQILSELIKKAPDFWSWREGVFRFVQTKEKIFSNPYPGTKFINLEDKQWSNLKSEDPYFLPIEELEKLIQYKERQQERDASLAALYSRIGDGYQRRLDLSESQDYLAEQQIAIDYFSKAIDLNRQLGLDLDLANNLNKLANLYSSQGRWSEAEPLYLEALKIRRKLFEEKANNEANNDLTTSLLNNLFDLLRQIGSSIKYRRNSKNRSIYRSNNTNDR